MPDALQPSSDLVSDATVDRASDEVVLRAKVSGEITLHNSPGVRSDLLRFINDVNPDRVEINLSDVPYMDSSAVAVLVEVLKSVRSANNDAAVMLTDLKPRVRGLLQIARLDTLFELEDADAGAAG